jgi:excisionase family DNA binding protein
MSVRNEPPLLMTISQAAAFLGISRRTLYRWAGARRLPGLRRIGRTLFVARPELSQWLDRGNNLDVPDGEGRQP